MKKIKITMKNLSAYTIAKYCSDETDCQYGINEIYAYIKRTKKVPPRAHIRLFKLSEKLKKFNNESAAKEILNNKN